LFFVECEILSCKLYFFFYIDLLFFCYMFLYTFVDTRHGTIELARELNEPARVTKRVEPSRVELDLQLINITSRAEPAR
jgi:hypothetical protein